MVSRFPAARLSDAELVRGAARGDAAAAGALWDRYVPLVRSVVRATLGPDSAADDLVQETFLGVLRNVSELRDPQALRPWLVSIALRCCRSELRRRKLRRWLSFLPGEALPEPAADPVDAPARAAVRALYRVLDTLSERRRLAFTLRAIHGMELADVARQLAVSESTAKREVAEARELIVARAQREPALLEWLTVGGGTP